MAKNKETRHSVRRHRRIHAQKDSSDSSPKENEKPVEAKTQSEREEKTHVVQRFCNAHSNLQLRKWAPNKEETSKLNSFHRRQLRQVLRIRWSQLISNENLYERTGTDRLDQVIRNAR